MPVLLRSALAIVAGGVVAFAVVIAVEMFSAIVHPFPADFDGSVEEICAHVERYPHWVLAVVVPLWAGAALAGTWVAGRFGNRSAALFLGLLLLAAVVWNIAMLPYPAWFKAATLIAVPAAIVAGGYLSQRRPAIAE